MPLHIFANNNVDSVIVYDPAFLLPIFYQVMEKYAVDCQGLTCYEKLVFDNARFVDSGALQLALCALGSQDVLMQKLANNILMKFEAQLDVRCIAGFYLLFNFLGKYVSNKYPNITSSKEYWATLEATQCVYKLLAVKGCGSIVTPEPFSIRFN